MSFDKELQEFDCYSIYINLDINLNNTAFVGGEYDSVERSLWQVYNNFKKILKNLVE